MTAILRCVVAALCALFSLGIAGPALANSKYAAFVMHADSGDVLLDKYADERRYPASLTKMMTLYLLFEELEAGRIALDTKMKVSATAAGQPPSKLGLTAGSTIDVDTAIKALVVKSANDVAVVVAEHLGGSEWKFAQSMTERARAMGMKRTTFRNASGLPNAKQTTTARDLATLSRRLIQDHPAYFDYFATETFSWNGRVYRTHNQLVRTYDGADGLKTGYTRTSGFNLATTAKRGGDRLIGVVLGGRSVRTRDAHMREILDQAFADIAKRPSLIAALHRDTPTPRLKPTLVAALAAAPTIAGNDALQDEIRFAAAGFGPVDGQGALDDLSALIAAVDSDDFNGSERLRLSYLDPSEEDLSEGDVDSAALLGWSVQIGAFGSKAQAQTELEAAAIAAGLTDRLRSVSPTTGSDGKTIYRARFTALGEREATELCARIRSAQLACFSLNEDANAQ